jgi:hypothetical protein
VIRLVLLFAASAAIVLPAWWLAGRIQDRETHPFFRLLCAAGLAMVGYLTFVNLLGRVFGHSTVLATIYVAASGVASIVIWLRNRGAISITPLTSTWRDWRSFVLLAVILGLPQWLLTVSTNYWDEVASSAIHITAPNQFAEGIFPPRHNALPDITIKYHYAFTILSGTVRWLTGFSANTSIDIVSTFLWLFTFLFVVFWLRDLAFTRAAAVWGGVATLLGGGLTWVYLKGIEAYNGFEVAPAAAQLVHKYDGTAGYLDNLLWSATVPSLHLRNGDASISNVPWDIAAQFQQHAVAMGIPLTLLALYLLTRWLARPRFGALFAATVLTFGVGILGHAVFGGSAAMTAGLVMLGIWIRRPTRDAFANVAVFTAAVTVLVFAHGGPFALGEQYGVSNEALTVRHGFGYPAGGVSGFLHWNLAGFGVPLLLALLAWVVRPHRSQIEEHREELGAERSRAATLAFTVITTFTVFSYVVPQLTFYTSESSSVEQFTEISKFFFSAHLGFAILSAYGVLYLLRRLPWGALVPLAGMMAVAPLTFVFVHSTTTLEQKVGRRAKPDTSNTGVKWLGFYRAPYFRGSIEEQMADTFRILKSGPHATFFDASGDERRHGFLSEMFVFGGSAFSVTPSRYERTGLGFRLGEAVVAARLRQSSRMLRLRPGAAEDCRCEWYYARPVHDLAWAPMIVRSRFDKLTAEGYFNKVRTGADRVLYSIEKPTADLDNGIAAYMRPRVVMQALSDWDGDGRDDLIFYDYISQRVIAGSDTVVLPESARGEFALLLVGEFPGDRRVDLHVGRMRDTEFRMGRTVDDIVEYKPWAWSYRASSSQAWNQEYDRWVWDGEMPFVADLDGDGFDSHVMYRPRTSEWFTAPMTRINGPALDTTHFPVPFAGRFLPGSKGDLGLWGQGSGVFVLRTLPDREAVVFKWGSGHPTDVLVPGDYDGDGMDEIGLWNRRNQFWYWRKPPAGPITQFRFGTPTSVPVPADYNHDGRIDAAYWEPAEGRIYVTFSSGRSTDLVIAVPPNSMPAFVNMY